MVAVIGFGVIGLLALIWRAIRREGGFLFAALALPILFVVAAAALVRLSASNDTTTLNDQQDEPTAVAVPLPEWAEKPWTTTEEDEAAKICDPAKIVADQQAPLALGTKAPDQGYLLAGGNAAGPSASRWGLEISPVDGAWTPPVSDWNMEVQPGLDNGQPVGGKSTYYTAKRWNLTGKVWCAPTSSFPASQLEIRRDGLDHEPGSIQPPFHVTLRPKAQVTAQGNPRPITLVEYLAATCARPLWFQVGKVKTNAPGPSRPPDGRPHVTSTEKATGFYENGRIIEPLAEPVPMVPPALGSSCMTVKVPSP